MNLTAPDRVKKVRHRENEPEKPVNPEISIITPVFNGRRFIEECLRAFIDQNCPAAEHIVVDGGSSDGTADVIRDFASRHPHIRWISEKDRGQSDAMNKGITLAQGSIVSFLNVDDFYEPGVLNRVIEIFRDLKEPAFVAGNCNVLRENDRIVGVNRPRNLAHLDLLMGWKANPIPANPSAYFYHRSLHEKVGFYDPESHYTLDVDFILRAVKGARQLEYVDELWGNFRFIPGAKTFTDWEAGRNWDRYNQTLQVHRDRLSSLERTVLNFKCARRKTNLWIRRQVKATLMALGLRTA